MCILPYFLSSVSSYTTFTESINYQYISNPSTLVLLIIWVPISSSEGVLMVHCRANSLNHIANKVVKAPLTRQ